MTTSSTGKITVTHILIPVGLMALTTALAFGFQVAQGMRDRDALNQNLGRMEEPTVQGDRLTKQFGGLVSGTKKLAVEGDPIAKEMVDRMKAAGIVVDEPQEARRGAAPTPIPGADAPTVPEPVKP